MDKDYTKKIIYLDYNATTPLRPEAYKAIQNALQLPLNASSTHTYGQQGRALIEQARTEIATLTGAQHNQIIFNSGATEGNNTILKHFARNYGEDKILTSAIEHSSILEAAPSATRIPVTADGLINLSALEEQLRTNRPVLVSIMAANNETGAIQPIKDAAALTHKYGSLLHCDAVQTAGKIPISMQEMGADFLTISSHKIGGPQGVGALIIGPCGINTTLIHGGGQEKSLRAGTENTAGIAGFGAAAKATLKHMAIQHAKENKLHSLLRNSLLKTKEITLYSQQTPHLKNTLLFSIQNQPSETLLIAFDLEGIAVSSGSACSSGRIEPSHVLKAMNHTDKNTATALRISFGWNTVESDIKAFLESFSKITTRLK